jgi:hypothetical protein
MRLKVAAASEIRAATKTNHSHIGRLPSLSCDALVAALMNTFFHEMKII